MYEIADLLKTTQEISDVFLYIVFVFTTVTFLNIQIYKIHTFSTNVMLKYTKWWLKQPSAYPSHSFPSTFFFFFFPELVLIQLIFQKHVPSHTNTCLEERISSRGLIQAVKAEKKSRLQLWEGNRLTYRTARECSNASFLPLCCHFHGKHHCTSLCSYIG